MPSPTLIPEKAARPPPTPTPPTHHQHHTYTHHCHHSTHPRPTSATAAGHLLRPSHPPTFEPVALVNDHARPAKAAQHGGVLVGHLWGRERLRVCSSGTWHGGGSSKHCPLIPEWVGYSLSGGTCQWDSMLLLACHLPAAPAASRHPLQPQMSVRVAAAPQAAQACHSRSAPPGGSTAWHSMAFPPRRWSA